MPSLDEEPQPRRQRHRDRDATPPAAWPIVAGALAGAAGVALSAAAAHVDASQFVQSAAAMCLAHAPLLILLGTPALAGRLRAPMLPAVMVLAGLLLFAGDMVHRAFLGTALFARAAPTGGSLLILAWIAVALLSLARQRRAPQADWSDGRG